MVDLKTGIGYQMDLNKGVQRQTIRPALLQGDAEAHKLEISCVRNGVPVLLSNEAVTGYFVRADGRTVLIDGTVEGGKACVVLPTECYAVEGTFELVVRASVSGDSACAIYWGGGAVRRSRTDAVVDPGQVVPNLEALLAQIAEMERVNDEANAVLTDLDGYQTGMVRASNVYLTPSNYATQLPDANDAMNGMTYFVNNEITAAHIKNLPMYGQFATLTTIHSRASDAHGKFQLYAGMGWMYLRTEYGSGTSFINWSPWQEVTNHADSLSGRINSGHFSHTSSGVCVEQRGLEVGATYRVVAWNMENALNGDQPMLYVFKKDGTNVDYKNVEKMGHWLVYHDIVVDDTVDYLRLYMNKASSATSCSCDWAVYKLGFGPMQEVLDSLVRDMGTLNQTAATYPNTTARIFRRVVCCGDSYTSGHVAVNGAAAATNEDFAWPAYMSLLTGSPWENCGCSGCNVLTWQTHERGLPRAKALGKAQAYVIGLMINDASSTERAVTLGTAADIGGTAQSYYGGMSAIIRELNAISPKAKIFVNTCPKSDAAFAGYNQAVRDIVTEYASTYPVHCIDLAEHAKLYGLGPLSLDAVGGHYSAIGYQQFAVIYERILSEYINAHVTAFQDVSAIEYVKPFDAEAEHNQLAQDVASFKQEIRKEINEQVSQLSEEMTKSLIGLPVECEKSGSIVSITDGAARPAVQLVTHIEPVQSGSGDPSPDNVRPISGWNKVAAQRTGKNIAEFVDGLAIYTDGSVLSHDKRCATKNPIKIKAGYSYVVSGVGVLFIYALYTENMEMIRRITSIAPGTVLDTSGGAYMHVCAYIDEETVATVETNKPQVELGTIATPYEPCQGQTLTADLPETVYGGFRNWTSGEQKSTKYVYQFTGDEVFAKSPSRAVYSMTWDNNLLNGWIAKIETDQNNKNIVCSHFRGEAYVGMSDDCVSTYLGTQGKAIGFFSPAHSDAAAFAAFLKQQYSAGTPVTVVCNLEPLYWEKLTPGTPQQIDMLKGTTNVWSDTGDTDLVYVADTKLYIDGKFAELEAAILSQGANV